MGADAMIANAKLEQMNRDDLQALQMERLRNVVKWVAEKSFFYKERFRTAGVRPEDIQTLEDAEKLIMKPNENFLKFFPDVELPEEKDRSSRSCGLRVGTWIAIRKIVNDYKLEETLGKYLPARDVGLFLDLAAYSIIEEDNWAQYYSSYEDI